MHRPPVSASSATAASSADVGSAANVSAARSFWARACCSTIEQAPAGGASGNRVIGPPSTEPTTLRGVRPADR